MAEQNFLGAGMKFPPQIDESTGRFKLASGLESVKESVYIILMTVTGERWLRPSFGSNIMEFAFADTSITVLNVMSNDIKNALLKNEPRISDVQININGGDDDGQLVVGIDYYVASEHTRDSMVFPFYMNADREVIDYDL